MLSSQATLSVFDEASDSSENPLDEQTADERALTELLRLEIGAPAISASPRLSFRLYQKLDALEEKLAGAPWRTESSKKFAEMIFSLQQRKFFLHGERLSTDDLDGAQPESADRIKIFNLFNEQLDRLAENNPTLLQLTEFETELGLYMQLDATCAYLSTITKNYPAKGSYHFIKIPCASLIIAATQISNEFLAYLEMRNPTEKIITLLRFEKTLARTKQTIDFNVSAWTRCEKMATTKRAKGLQDLADIKDTFNRLFTIVKARCICIEVRQALQAESDCASQQSISLGEENKPSPKEVPFRNLAGLFLPHYNPSLRYLGFFEKFEKYAITTIEQQPNQEVDYKTQPDDFKKFIKQFGCHNEAEWKRFDLETKRYFINAFQKSPEGSPRSRSRASI